MKGSKDNQSSKSNQAKITDFMISRGIIKKNQSHSIVRQDLKKQIKEKKEKRQSPIRSHTQSLQSISPPIRVHQLEKKPVQKQDQRTLNLLFYLNKIPSQPYGEFIDKMHSQWYNNYEKLERDHSFIQWIFPNSFQSRFNMHSRPLSLQQAQEFKKSPQVLERYIKSYNMMLAFYGMKIKDKQTGELARSRHPHYQQRFHKTLITSFHNHMRITRILCSLTELGFVRYASQLCKFLKQQIQSAEGKLQILRKYNVYKDWKPYQNGIQSQKNTNVYMTKISKRIKHHQDTPKVTKVGEKEEPLKAEKAQQQQNIKQT